MAIISCSRRTDIPAFYGNWFLNRMHEGYVLVRNPRNPWSISRVPLDRESVDAFVFWSKNPKPFEPALDYLDENGYPYYFQFTLNDYDKSIEPNVPPVTERIMTMQALSRRIGPSRMTWRYDPIILTQSIKSEHHLDRFSKLCAQLEGYIHECSFKFVVPYVRTLRRMKKANQSPVLPDHAVRYELVQRLSEIAHQHKIKLKGCCEDDYSTLDVEPAICISKERMELICSRPVTAKKDPGQRSDCKCIASIDIGSYNSCFHQCNYCYAIEREAYLNANLQAIKDDSAILGLPVQPGSIMTVRKMK